MPRPLALALVPLLLLAAALTGCTQPTRLPPPEPSASGEPLFASDEEALAAATAAYEEYLAVVDGALSDPTQSTPLDEVALGDVLNEANQSIDTFSEQGLRFVGKRQVVDTLLQQYASSDSATEVRLYVCESVADVDVLDANDQSVVEPTRPDLTAFQVAILIDSDGQRVFERTVWTDGQFCSV